MTVAELIAKLQEMPQDLPVYHADHSYDYLPVDEIEVMAIWDDDETYRGALKDRPKIEAVILT